MHLFCFLFLIFALVAVNRADTCGVNCSYTIEDGKLTITGTGDNASTGEYCEGFHSTTAPWYSNRGSITEIEVKNLEVIGGCAFSDFSNVTKATIDAREIGQGLFQSCGKLNTVSFLNVTKLEGGIFEDCTQLATVTLPKTVEEIGADPFRGSVLTAIYVDKGNSVFSSEDGVLFENSSDVTGYTKKLARYPPGKADKTYTIPDDVKEVELDAFEGCNKLESLSIPGSVVWFHSRLVGCSSLSKIEVSSDARWFFSEDGILFGKQLDNLKNSVKRYPPAKTGAEYTIQSGVITVEPHAFDGNQKLDTLSIPASLLSFDSSALNGCSSLTTIKVDKESGIFLIDDVALVSKKGIKDEVVFIKYPPKWKDETYHFPTEEINITRIGENAFEGSIFLRTLTIPDSVKFINNRAFKDCRGLDNITFPPLLYTFETDALDGCTGLTSISGGGAKDSWCSTKDGVLFCAGGLLVKYPSKKNAKNYVAEGVSIAQHAFEQCTTLESITIPDSVYHIAKEAFVGCNLLSTVEYFGTKNPGYLHSFVNCPKLKTVYVPYNYESDTFCGMAVIKRPQPPSSSSSAVTLPSLVMTAAVTFFFFLFF